MNIRSTEHGVKAKLTKNEQRHLREARRLVDTLHQLGAIGERTLDMAIAFTESSGAVADDEAV